MGSKGCVANTKVHTSLPFEEIIRRHEREVARYSLRVLGDSEDAADLCQETWLRAYHTRRRPNSYDRVRPWLYAIARDLCRTRVRESARLARVMQDKGVGLASDTMENESRFLHETGGYVAVHIRELILNLQAKERQALYLHYLGLNYVEIANVMGCSRHSARANISQTIRQLKRAWEKQ